MRFRLTQTAKKYLDSQDQETVRRVYDALRRMTKTPPEGDIVPLTDKENTYRARIGQFRIIFKKQDNIAYVTDIGPRGQIYKQI